jgi:hypothetical protein
VAIDTLPNHGVFRRIARMVAQDGLQLGLHRMRIVEPGNECVSSAHGGRGCNGRASQMLNSEFSIASAVQRHREHDDCAGDDLLDPVG